MIDNVQVRLTFLEREFFKDEETQSVPGYKPARIATKEEIVQGRVIIPEELRRAQYLDTAMHTATLDVPFETTLDRVLQASEGGRAWLAAYKEYFRKLFEEDAPLELRITPIWFHSAIYQFYPDDYFQRPQGYQPPTGELCPEFPLGASYVRIEAPFRRVTGERIPNLGYKRQAVAADGTKGSYAIMQSYDDPKNLPGCFLGPLQAIEFGLKPQEIAFPISHHLDVTYPSYLRCVDSINPLTVRFEATTQEKRAKSRRR